jgi:peptidoglycan/LPS O-acetylase OafA/YrhL
LQGEANIETASSADGGTKGSGEPLLRNKMPELDSIRGIAILWVLLHHAFLTNKSTFTAPQRIFLSFTSAGHLGVSLFFVLSGFLITGLLLDSRGANDYYKRFYIRRALRILPAYYAILILLVILGMTSRGFLIASLFYCSNLSPLLGIVMSYPVLWSLAVEEHFYLIWPAVVRNIRVRCLIVIAMGMVIVPIFLRFVSFYLAYPQGYSDAHPSAINYYTWNTADGIASGSLLSVMMRYYSFDRRKLFRFSLISFLIAGLVGIVGLPLGFASRRNAIGTALQPAMWNIAFVGLLGVFLLLGTSRWKRWVTPRFLLFLGEISYGLYLFHYGVIQEYNKAIAHIAPHTVAQLGPFGALWLRFFVGAVVSVGLAFISRRYFENPFLRLKNRWTRT